jgi:hypothetical protein
VSADASLTLVVVRPGRPVALPRAGHAQQRQGSPPPKKKYLEFPALANNALTCASRCHSRCQDTEEAYRTATAGHFVVADHRKIKSR